jgi:hypothetical protein
MVKEKDKNEFFRRVWTNHTEIGNSRHTTNFPVATPSTLSYPTRTPSRKIAPKPPYWHPDVCQKADKTVLMVTFPQPSVRPNCERSCNEKETLTLLQKFCFGYPLETISVESSSTKDLVDSLELDLQVLSYYGILCLSVPCPVEGELIVNFCADRRTPFG